jgi:hypothetical protein
LSRVGVTIQHGLDWVVLFIAVVRTTHNYSTTVNLRTLRFTVTCTRVLSLLYRGADKPLAFPVCIITKRIFLGWVEEVRTMKS